MMLSEKIIQQRKKNGWSQEELADKMNVSRQAVSKWESAQSTPELEKLLLLSELFGVTTDYLLKDSISDETVTAHAESTAPRRVALSEANAYLTSRWKASRWIAAATFLCCLSPVPLLLLGAAAEHPNANLSDRAAGGIGLCVLLLFVAAAVGMYVYCGFQNAPYEFLDKEPFETEHGVKEMVKERQTAYRTAYGKGNLIGICVCVLSPIALFCGIFTENEFFMTVMLTVTITLAGIGAAILIVGGVRSASMQKLLKEGEFSETGKKKEKIKETVGTVYWLIAAAVYLVWSFLTNDWDSTWIVWPIAAVLFAAVITVCNLLMERRK